MMMLESPYSARTRPKYLRVPMRPEMFRERLPSLEGVEVKGLIASRKGTTTVTSVNPVGEERIEITLQEVGQWGTLVDRLEVAIRCEEGEDTPRALVELSLLISPRRRAETRMAMLWILAVIWISTCAPLVAATVGYIALDARAILLCFVGVLFGLGVGVVPVFAIRADLNALTRIVAEHTGAAYVERS